MNILALDMATKTGWAALCSGRIYIGTRDMKLKRGESPGIRFLHFRALLKELHELMDKKIDLISYEQAHHRGGAATAVALGLVAEMQAFAADIGIETYPVHTASLKKWATGHGKASKEVMIEEAKQRVGMKIEDDNQADAVLLLLYARQEFKI